MRRNITEKMIVKRLSDLDHAYNQEIMEDNVGRAHIIRLLIREYRFMLDPEEFHDPITYWLPKEAEEKKNKGNDGKWRKV
jgi:hypothetical protein